MTTTAYECFKSPLGTLALSASAQGIQSVCWEQSPRARNVENDWTRKAREEILAYLEHDGNYFTVPLDISGTDHQQRVWRYLSRIPFGETVTYGEIAKVLHSSPRAVGQACRKNPVPIIIPCHRVLSVTGTGGFSGQAETQQAGHWIRLKKRLLAHESQKFQDFPR